jgi:hypothetical protein
MIIVPKNWATFQHYKDRSPAWIKLHRSILDDYEFSCLPVASRALAPLLWLLASEYEDGKIDASENKLAFRLRMSVEELREAIKPLIDGGFFVLASGALAECKHDAIPEKEKEGEIEKEKKDRPKREARLRTPYPEDFENGFWKPYPTSPNMSKSEALAAWKGLSEEEKTLASAAVPAFKNWLREQKDHPVVHACRFLKQRRFEGFAATAPPIADDRDREDMAALRRQMMEAINGGKVGNAGAGRGDAGVGVVRPGESKKLLVEVRGPLQSKAG